MIDVEFIETKYRLDLEATEANVRYKIKKDIEHALEGMEVILARDITADDVPRLRRRIDQIYNILKGE